MLRLFLVCKSGPRLISAARCTHHTENDLRAIVGRQHSDVHKVVKLLRSLFHLLADEFRTRTLRWCFECHCDRKTDAATPPRHAATRTELERGPPRTKGAPPVTIGTLLRCTHRDLRLLGRQAAAEFLVAVRVLCCYKTTSRAGNLTQVGGAKRAATKDTLHNSMPPTPASPSAAQPMFHYLDAAKQSHRGDGDGVSAALGKCERRLGRVTVPRDLVAAAHVDRAEPLPADFLERPGGHTLPWGGGGALLRRPSPATAPGNPTTNACSTSSEVLPQLTRKLISCAGDIVRSCCCWDFWLGIRTCHSTWPSRLGMRAQTDAQNPGFACCSELKGTLS